VRILSLQNRNENKGEGVVQRQKSDEYALRLYSLYIGGLVAFILVILQALLGVDRLGPAGVISVGAFAIALPPLAGGLVVNFVEEKYAYAHPRSASARALNIFFSAGVVATFVGVSAAFWRVSWIIGLLFVIILVATGFVYMWYISHLEEVP